MELSRKINLAAREVQFIRHVLPGASTTQIKRHTHEYLNGQTPESVDERTIFMSMFNDIEWTPVCTMPKKWKHLRPNPSQDVASWSPRQKIRGGTDVPTNLKENQNIVALQSILPTDISSDRAIIEWTVEKTRKNSPFPRYIRKTRRFSSNTILLRNLLLYLQSNFAGGMRLKTRYVRREEKIDLVPEQLTLITQKNSECNMPQARGDSLPQLTVNRETLIRRASEQAAFARTVEKWTIPHHRICCGRKQLYSSMQRTLRAKNFSTLEITGGSQRSCQDQTSDWN